MAETTSSSSQTPRDTAVLSATADSASPFPLPRVTIRFCTQCKWMLRAAYFAQELLSTFSTSLGEVALQPSTGGTFVVAIQHRAPSTLLETSPEVAIQTTTLWDRKVDGGFPETKELKRRVRDVIEPGRNLGHVDRDHKKEKETAASTETGAAKIEVGQDSNMPEQQKQESTAPSGPRWPTSVSALQAQAQGSQDGSNPDPIRKGHSQPMMPASDDPAAANSQSQRIPPAHSSAQSQSQERPGDVYQPRMAGGGIMPVVRPPGEARNEEARARMEEAARKKEQGAEVCEDCQ